MPSSNPSDDETSLKNIAVPQQSSAVKQSINVTPRRRVSANNGKTTNSAPAREKTYSRKQEPTLLGDFLLGRPSPNRVRRRSLDLVRAEMKQSTVNKLQPPGTVRARVRQWQQSSAATEISDSSTPASEPQDIQGQVGEQNVNEQEIQNIKIRKQQLNRGKQKCGAKIDLSQPAKCRNSPKKRVVSDDHWVKNKLKTKGSPRLPNKATDKNARVKTPPSDSLKLPSQDATLKTRIEAWACHTTNETSSENGPRDLSEVKVSVKQNIIDGSRESATRRASLNNGTPAETSTRSDDRPEGDCSIGVQHISKGKCDNLTPTPTSNNRGKCSPILRKETDNGEETTNFRTTASGSLNFKPLHERSRSPQESIAEIPVGFSAFSVLDIPLGGDARTTRPTKPFRTPSLSAVPKVLKKVYTEGMKMVHDAVDPPRVGINQPPSIESWLNSTSDPFIDSQSVSGSTFELTMPTTQAESSERDKRQDIRTTPNGSENQPRGENMQEGVNQKNDVNTPNKGFKIASDLNNQNIKGSRTIETTPHISPTSLKRSRAIRTPSSPIKQPKKSQLRGALVDAFHGESEPHGSIESLAKPVESFQVWEEEQRHSSRSEPIFRGFTHEPENTLKKTPLKECQSLPSHSIASEVRTPEISSSMPHQRGTLLVKNNCPSATVPAENSNTSSLSEASSDTSRTTYTRTTVTQDTPTISHIKPTEPRAPRQNGSATGLKRRLTKHSDLLSVLSLPDTAAPNKSKCIRSARSVRTTRSHLATATMPDLFQELADDESKYKRELKTLVDGVIPVLLTWVLSKPKSTAADRLNDLCATGEPDTTTTKSIVDMGTSLERLKNLHKQIPLQDLDLLLHWASNAHQVYENYLTSWRMGFQNVIINLAPATQSTPDEDQSLLNAMPRNANGDVLNEDGERVDVAFLLRRPLVRIKYLAKLTKGICTVKPSVQAATLNEKFQILLIKARRRIKEEEARLEDEAASNIDPTRTRDPRTLSPIGGVKIDRTRQVNAEDLFEFSMSHSNGQRLDCRTELILRDKPRDKADPGDVLICEVDSLGRWLLFPPIDRSNISARSGRRSGELVVMIQGLENTEKWYELFTLTTDDKTALEWIQMLGSMPKPQVPRRVSLSSTSINPGPQSAVSAEGANKEKFALSSKANTGGSDTEVPIGERCRLVGELRPPGSHYKQEPRLSVARQSHLVSHNSAATKREVSPISTRGSLKDGIRVAGRDSNINVKQAGERRSHLCQDPISPDSKCTHAKPDDSSFHSPAHNRTLGAAQPGQFNQIQRPPEMGMELPRDLKSSNAQNTPVAEAGISKLSTQEIEPGGFLTEPKGARKKEDQAPSPPPHRIQGLSIARDPPGIITPPPMPKSRRSSSPLKHEYQPSEASDTSSSLEDSEADDSSSESSSEEELEAADLLVPLPNNHMHSRRISSRGSFYSLPNTSLTPSNSASQAPYKGVPFQANTEKVRLSATISYWSDKGCWVDLHSDICSVVISAGLIQAFDMNAPSSNDDVKKTTSSSDSLDISTETNDPTERPLVALELTPIVPLRQSTAVDIEIRSPPTSTSTAKCSHTVRFRSRTLQECNTLYAAIHSARMKNPVYLKLEQERVLSSYGSQSYEAAVSANRRRSWFGRSKSYRVSTRAPSDTISEDTTNSFSSAISRLRNLGGLGSFNIARSSVDMKHGIFNIRSGTTSLETSTAGSATSGITPPRTPTGLSVAPNSLSSITSLKSSNIKIRLYILETSSKWNDLGNAFLTVTQPPRGMRQASSLYHGVEKRIIVTRDPSSKKNPIGKPTDTGMHSSEGGLAPIVILDIVLGGGCFSRLGVVGIVMNVWEDIVGDNGEVGMIGAIGGVSGRTRKWMFQCANAAEAQWIFALVGGGVR